MLQVSSGPAGPAPACACHVQQGLLAHRSCARTATCRFLREVHAALPAPPCGSTGPHTRKQGVTLHDPRGLATRSTCPGWCIHHRGTGAPRECRACATRASNRIRTPRPCTRPASAVGSTATAGKCPSGGRAVLKSVGLSCALPGHQWHVAGNTYGQGQFHAPLHIPCDRAYSRGHVHVAQQFAKYPVSGYFHNDHTFFNPVMEVVVPRPWTTKTTTA